MVNEAINKLNNLNNNPSLSSSILFDLVYKDIQYCEIFDSLVLTDEDYLNDVKKGLFKKVKYPVYEYYFHKCLTIIIKDFDKIINTYDAIDLLAAFMFGEGFMISNVNIYFNEYIKIAQVKRILKEHFKKETNIDKEVLAYYIYGYLLVKVSLYIIENRKKVYGPSYPEETLEKFKETNLYEITHYLDLIYKEEAGWIYYKLLDIIKKILKSFL